MSYNYPSFEFGVPGPVYYVEFDRGSQKNTFTLFKRQFIQPQAEWDAMIKQADNTFATSLMSNEGHPWNIMTDKYGPDGSMPDTNWVKWMVDALNYKSVREEKVFELLKGGWKMKKST